MIGHISEPLAKILFPLMKCCKILEIKVEISGEKRGGGIEIPAIFYVYGAIIHKLQVKKVSSFQESSS